MPITIPWTETLVSKRQIEMKLLSVSFHVNKLGMSGMPRLDADKIKSKAKKDPSLAVVKNGETFPLCKH